MSTDDDDPDERLMDWALHERLGGERPPDLLGAVRARLAGAAVPNGPRAMHGTQRWLAAACVLLGTAVVCGVALWPKRGPEPAVPLPAQQPHTRPAVQVNSLADVAALPAGTRAVEAIQVGDDVIEALTRLHDLEVLVVREPSNESFGMSLKMSAPKNPQHVTAASWAHFAKFTKLRRLELSGTVLVGRFGDDKTAAPLAALERLPLLEEVTLRCLDTRDAVLVRLAALRNLRSLDLSFNHGFSESGVVALLGNRSLRKLSLRGCQQLHGPWLARLGELPELEELDLSAIDGINWRVGMAEPMDTDSEQLFGQARGWANSLQRGVNDEALAGIAKAPRLRILEVGGGCFTEVGLRALGACATLTELGIAGAREHGHGFVEALPKGLRRLEVCGDFSDAFCAALRDHLTELRHVDVAACGRITDRGIADLCAIPALRVLDLRQMRGLTAQTAQHLAAAKQLEELDLRHNDWLTLQHVRLIHVSLPKLRVLQTNFSDYEVAQATLPEPVIVRTVAEIAALPADTRSLIAGDIEDDCMPAIARLRSLERLAIVAQWTDPGMRRKQPKVRSITDAGLRQLGGMPALRSLELGGELQVVGTGFDVLGALPALQELTLELMKVSDEGLAHVAQTPGLRKLHVRYTQGFGVRTFEAIERLAELRDLSLQGCVHVEDSWLTKVVGLPELERLDLGMIGSHTFFSGITDPLPAAEPGSGVTDRVLEALSKARKLRSLRLSHAGITGAGLLALNSLDLHYLDLSGTNITASSLQCLPNEIERLNLSNCVMLQDVGRIALKMTRLRVLELQHCPLLTDASLENLVPLPTLRSLDVSWCPRFTADAVAGVVALTQLEVLSLRGWKVFGDAEWAKVRAMPNLKRLDTDKGTETLR